MLESFLILLAGGVMLAALISDPKAVTLLWLRLAGLIAFVLSCLALYFARGTGRIIIWMLAATVVATAGQLAFVQMAQRRTQRAFALAASVLAVVAGTNLILLQPGAAYRAKWVAAISCSGTAAMCGLALMDMLLGHAYLTASKMGIAPFRRLNRALGTAWLLRAICAVGIAHFVNQMHPVAQLWVAYGLYIGVRWLVGLVVPGIFIYMAGDCIKRRSTQSATGILYVTGVLIFIGEIIALQLVRDTGLPF